MHILGIDPGITGALALYDTTTGDVEVRDMPTLDVSVTKRGKRSHRNEIEEGALWYAILMMSADVAIVERVRARPIMSRDGTQARAGIVQQGRMCEAFGIVRGVLGAMQLPRQFVEPSVWKRKMGLTGKGKDDSLLMARHKFPTVDLSRKKDHNRAEALLLCEYARLYLDL